MRREPAWVGLIEVGALLVGLPLLLALAAAVLGVEVADGVDTRELLHLKLVEGPAGLLLVLALQARRGAGLRELGWRRGSRGLGPDLIAGALAVVPLLAVALVVGTLLRALGFASEMPLSLDGPGAALALLGAAVVAAVVEEVQFRGFVFQRLEAVLQSGGSRRATTLRAAVLASLGFAALHAWEGPASVGAILAVALGLQWLYLRCGRRLAAPILAHALFNAVQVGLLFALGSD